MKIREDAWSHENDVLLAKTVLAHIREGSTQLRAFDEVGDELNRTSAACGFRWNAVVRQKYLKHIKEAKKERKQRKRQATYLSEYRPIAQPIVSVSEESISIPLVIDFLKNLETNKHTPNELVKENEKLLKENLELLTKTKELEKELELVKEEHTVIEEDYQALIQIMNRARRMAILQEDDSNSHSTFRMDKNGNLEKMAK